MLSFLLRLFALVVFVLLAAAWLIHEKQFQWQCGALAAYVASTIVGDPVVVRYTNRTPAE